MPEPDDVATDVLAGTVWAPELPRPTPVGAADEPGGGLDVDSPTASDSEPAPELADVDAVADTPGRDRDPDPDPDPDLDEEPDLDQQPDPEPDGAEASDSRRRRVVVAALTAVVVGLAVTSGLLLRSVSRHDAKTRLREEVVAAARQAAVNFTTIDYRTLDRDLARVADGATGEFRQEFTGQATSKEFTDRVRTTKVVSVGEVLDAAVADLSDDRAVVLVIADSTVTNSSLPAPGAVRHVRLKVTMTLVDGRWLVSDLAPAV